MTTLSSHGIASWSTDPEAPNVASHAEAASTIATTTAHPPAPQWEHCLDAMIDEHRRAARMTSRDEDAPSLEAIDAAMQWLVWLKQDFPHAPPTSVTPEPGGGLIIERRARQSDGHEVISELTLYNDGRAEMTYFVNGKVLEIIDVPFAPSPYAPVR